MNTIVLAQKNQEPITVGPSDIDHLLHTVCRINFIMFSRPKAEFHFLRGGKFTAEFDDMRDFECYVNGKDTLLGTPIKVWERTKIVREGYAGTF